jgi:acetylornithine deacetylase/succinyl-diaminopimelate desuccinylase-like protein
MSSRPTSSSVINTRLKTFLAELVQMPTLTAETATCKAALDWIKYQVRDLPLHLHDFTHNGHSALILTTRQTKRPRVMLHCHIDVSPAPTSLMQLTERGGRYYGRGVFDMKYAAAAYLDVLLSLGAKLAAYDLGVIFTTDEEATGGIDGAAQLAGRGWGGQVMINADAIPGWNIEHGAKGAMRYRIESTGQSGHGSRPWQYRNAITQIINFYTDLLAQFPAEPCGDPGHIHDTVSIGYLNGGYIDNQIPSEAVAGINIRLVPGHSIADMAARINDIVARHPHVVTELITADESISIDPNHPEAQRLRRLIQQYAGVQPGFTLSHGASENPHYVKHGQTVLMFAPPGGGHHSKDEWIDAAGVEQFAQIIRAYLDEVAQD